MKFIKGQKIVCIAEKNEWNPILSDFNRSLQLALGNIHLPNKGGQYIVNNPMELHFDGKCYISIIGFGGTPMLETAFEPVKAFECSNTESETLISIKRN